MDKILQIISQTEVEPLSLDRKKKPITKISANLEPEHMAAIYDVVNSLNYDQTKALRLLIEAGLLYLDGELGIGNHYDDILDEIYKRAE